jgi:hypothetical protein
MQDVFCFAVLANAITGTMYTDITGPFPVRSFKSMQYVFVAYTYNLNAIIIQAIPSCTNASMVQALTKVIAILTSGGYHPALNLMDNECSAAVDKYSAQNNQHPTRPPSQPLGQCPQMCHRHFQGILYCCPCHR